MLKGFCTAVCFHPHKSNLFFVWRNSPNLAQATSLLRFLDHA
jgi:hypothetical protein